MTGATGFIGQRFIIYNSTTYNLRTVSLRKLKLEDINFSNVDAIVHLAGIAHRMKKIDNRIYYNINHDLTIRFAKLAKDANVPHFLFISTVKVFGDEPESGYLDLKSPTIPTDPYGDSKLMAEKSLQSIESNQFTVSIIRPPLVYGPGVKGNLIRLLKLTEKNFPLPFKRINNQRSMVFLDNLIAQMNKVLDNKVSGIFIAGDINPISTSDLIFLMYQAREKKPFWFQMPTLGVKILQKIKPELMKRLFGSYVIDNTESNRKLKFQPPFDTKEGIFSMVRWYERNNT